MKKFESLSSFEESLLILLTESKENSISVKRVLELLSGKGRFFLIAFLCIPFCQPIQIPGLSFPFGILITFIGLRAEFGNDAWIPKSILLKKISSSTLQNIGEKSLWVIKKIKPFIHPRLIFICHHPILKKLNGILISFLGLLLALPLPIPFSNLIVAWPILFISLGLLEDDGLLLSLGYFLVFLCVIFFTILVFSFKFFKLNYFS